MADIEEEEVDREPTNQSHRLYTVYRGQIEHEDNLIGHRIDWLLAAEAFLFVGYEVALGFRGITTYTGLAGSAHVTIYVLPVLGMALAILAQAGILAATGRLNQLRKQFKVNVGKLEKYPHITSQKAHRNYGQLQALCVAPLVFLAWMVILVVPALIRVS
ncbi:MAG: hypothetical protein ABSB09_01595 [Acidimicrobiales bacterium]|jgi:hypothetical protein